MTNLFNPRLPFALAVFAAFLAFAPAPLSAGETKSEAPNGKNAAKPHLYVGMPAAELRALIGKPEKVVQVKVKEGQAEIWLYKRLLRTSTDVVPIGSKPIMGKHQNGDGSWSDVVLANEEVTKHRRTTTYQVASFLIADGKYLARTLTEEKEQFWE